MIKRSSYQAGTVQLKSRVDGPDVWVFRWRQPDGKRRAQIIGSKQDFHTKADATRAAETLRRAANADQPSTKIPTVAELVEQYRKEKMPQRYSTRRSYNAWLNNHVLPKWGECSITDVQARPVELWLLEKNLTPKSRVAIKGLLDILWDFAMWLQAVPMQRNPMELVTIKGASKRMRKPRSLTVDEFQKFITELGEPFRTMALVCACLGLRISECLALKWSDVDWFKSTLTVERGIVHNHVDDAKTEESRREMFIDGNLLEVLKAWKQASQFYASESWMFASPHQANGRLPWSYARVFQIFRAAAKRAGIGALSTHCMRHSYRSWLDAVGTSVAVQQKLMRHVDIRTTMRYGDVVTNEMVQANSKVVEMALPRKVV